jgi:6-pyruvoyl-tetrahydropterin synthase
MAREINRKAEIRVENIMANVKRVLLPQKDRIAYIGEEIAKLTEEISLSGLVTKESAPKITEVASVRREFSMREPEYFGFSKDKVHSDQEEIITPDPQMEARREFSMRKPQELDISEEIIEVNQPVQSEPNPPSIAQREFSMRKPQELDISEEIMEVNQPEHSEHNPQTIVRREFSLREPQGLDIPLDYLEPNQEELHKQPQPSIPIQEYSLPEPMEEEITNYNLAMNLIEQNESKIHLDVFVDARYFASDGVQIGQIQKHSWQVKIKVEVPSDNHEFAGYGKASAAVTSTLQRFDNIVLNEVYPFDIIEPNTENIAMYFYNCLQDTVSMMDLILEEISLWEKQTLIMQVNSRNKEFDDILQRGDDILQDIRGLMAARERGEDKNNTVSKGRRGHIFGNK